MSKRSNRLLITMLAIVASVLLVLVLSMAGDKSRGPIANILRKAGNFVTGIEDRFILDKRAGTRKEQLAWLQAYQADINLLKNPSPILLGAYDNKTGESYASILDLEDTLGTVFPLIHIYTAWGDKSHQQFPRAQARAIQELGSIPVITWEPWLSEFNQEDYPGLPGIEERDKGGLALIAGGMFDEYIRRWARDAKELRKPVFVRLGHEMNDPYRYPWGPHNNQPQDFVKAWQHVNVLFKAEGADNVLWIWSPHPSYGMFNELYPGDFFVDYIGINIMNFGDVATWSKWWSFKEIIGNAYKPLSYFNKPIMISELGCLSVGGDRAEWYRETMSNMVTDYPLVKSILFFHFSEDRTTTPQAVDWTIMWDKPVVEAIKEEIQKWPENVRTPAIKP